MALEIKGLKAKALRMRQHIDGLNRAYDAFNEKAPDHIANVSALAKQVDELNSDLDFAATALGNSTEQSSEQEKPEEPPIGGSLDIIDMNTFPKRMHNL